MENATPPSLADAQPRTPANAPSLAERLFSRWLERLRAGRLTVEFPSGALRTFVGEEPGPQARLRIRRPGFIWDLILNGDIGFAEAFLAGDCDTPDLTALLSLGLANEEALAATLTRPRAVRLINRLRHAFRANTRTGSRRNIAAHYDLGNDFFGLWLDGTMSYSSALFEDFDEPHEDAQRRKYHRLIGLLDLAPGERVLEIGCGWGGFAEIAASHGCEVVGLTLSREQAAFARHRMAAAGLEDKVEIRLQDYRDVPDTFDKVVSIEMFEAVGEANWPTYFRMIDRVLKPGGRAALQSIIIDDRYFDGYRRDPDFIQRYIFPGGMLPSPNAIDAAIDGAGFKVSDRFYFGKSYAETLRRWRTAFLGAWPDIARLGFDRRFERMWRYYLAYCEAGFESGRIDVGHFLIERR